MPFGLDLKSLVLGVLLAWFVIPWIQSKFYASRSASQSTGS